MKRTNMFTGAVRDVKKNTTSEGYQLLTQQRSSHVLLHHLLDRSPSRNRLIPLTLLSCLVLRRCHQCLLPTMQVHDTLTSTDSFWGHAVHFPSPM